MTHLECAGAPSILLPGGAFPGTRAVWCGALITYAGPVDGAMRRVTNTTTDPRHCDCPACWLAVRAARSDGAPPHGICQRCGKGCEGDRTHCELCRGREGTAYP